MKSLFDSRIIFFLRDSEKSRIPKLKEPTLGDYFENTC
jgi:hypothetical protein